jgi:hypothetical protein
VCAAAGELPEQVASTPQEVVKILGLIQVNGRFYLEKIAGGGYKAETRITKLGISR